MLFAVGGLRVCHGAFFILILEWRGVWPDHERRVGLGHSEAPGRGSDHHNQPHLPRGFDAVLPCRAAVVVPDPQLRRRVIRRHRRQIGSCWRKLTPGRQALLVLAYLRKGETFAELAAGFGVGTATAWRYVSETTALLVARSPKLRRALADARKAGRAYVVTGGTLIPVNRVAADRPFYSGKHRRHGMNLQVISAPDGEILWVSGPLPGAVHDLTAARDLGHLARTAGLRAGRARGQGLRRRW